MTDKQKIETLRQCFEETIWMAIRYAHGRNTYAPSMVRDAVNAFKTVFPDWKLREDKVIKPPIQSVGTRIIMYSEPIGDYVHLVHEAAEGRYELTGYDLHVIEAALQQLSYLDQFLTNDLVSSDK